MEFCELKKEARKVVRGRQRKAGEPVEKENDTPGAITFHIYPKQP